MHATPEDARRLAEVDAYRKLVSGAAPVLQRFVALVAHVAGTPAAGISFVGAERTWLAARVGLEADSLPLEKSFCSRTVVQRDPFVVTDAANDARLEGTPLASVRFRFYAGCPLRTPAGFAIGALFAMDREPRELSAQQLELLQILALQVESDLRARLDLDPIVANLDAGARTAITLRDRSSSDQRELCLYRIRTQNPHRILVGAPDLPLVTGVAESAIRSESDLLALVHPEDRQVITAALDNPASAVHPVLVRWRKSNGEYGWLELRHELQYDERGELLGLEARALPREGRHEHLEGLAASRARLVATILDQQRQHDELLALLVHDLKAPISSVLAAAYALGTGDDLDEPKRGLLDEIEASARSLDRLVLGLLDLHRYEGGRLVPHRTEVDLVEVAREAVRTVGVYARLHGRSIEITAPPRLEARVDRDLVRRTIENLLDNAIRFARSRILVELCQNPGTEVVVRDDGFGIPPEHREAIFDKFAQRMEIGRRGRGLGLTFCRMVVEAHGGTIAAEQNTPAGAAFRIQLP